MAVIEQLVAVGEIQKPCTDAVEPVFRAARHEIGADARCGLRGGFVSGVVLHLRCA
jgi:hypothetical protein